MSEDPKKSTIPLADVILDRVEEVKKETEISHYKGTPHMPTQYKARDKHRAKVICYLKAIGFKNKDIAAAIGGTSAEVTRVLKSQSAQEEIERLQSEIFVAEPAKIFESILPQAVRIAVNAMMSRKTKSSVRVDAAFKFMDRALGKPTQTVEHKTNLVRELIMKVSNEVSTEAPLDADFFVVDEKENKDGKEDQS